MYKSHKTHWLNSSIGTDVAGEKLISEHFNGVRLKQSYPAASSLLSSLAQIVFSRDADFASSPVFLNAACSARSSKKQFSQRVHTSQNPNYVETLRTCGIFTLPVSAEETAALTGTLFATLFHLYYFVQDLFRVKFRMYSSRLPRSTLLICEHFLSE